MAQQYLINGTITPPEGGDRADLRVQAFDRDLPSLERLQSTPQLLGDAITDAEGRFSITFTLERFTSGDSVGLLRRSATKNADISFRVFDGNGHELDIRNIRALGRDFRGNQIIFNAPTDLGVEIIVTTPAAGDSEYEKLRALVGPVIGGISLALLTEEDIAFLAAELGIEQQPEAQRIEWLRRSALLAAQTNLQIEAFYGWGRKNLPAAFAELVAGELNRLPDIRKKLLSQPIAALVSTLQEAIAEKIIPANFPLNEITSEIERLQVEDGSVSARRFVGRLVAENSGEPLIGLAVDGFDLSVNGEPKSLGRNVSDDSGVVAFIYVTPKGGDQPPRKLRLDVILDPQRNTKQTIEVQSGSDQEIVEIKVPVPASDQPTPPLTELVDTLQLDLPEELRSFLNDQNIVSLADIRRSGGLQHLSGIPVPGDNPTVKLLEAHADLSRLSPDPSVNAQLIEKNYDSVMAVAKAPRSEFVNNLHEQLGDFNAAEMHVTANAEMHFLNSIVTGVSVEQANGFKFDALDAEAMDVAARCGCEDCEAAVSPLAYLADLLNYTIQHVKNGATPIDIDVLAATFHQPFGLLVATCNAVETKVRQVRLAVEALRSYLVVHPPTAAQQSSLDVAEQNFRIGAYTSITQRLGAAYDELRLTQTAELKDRQALAERLGIEEKRLNAIILDPGTLTEAQLEQLFGLIDTTRDPLASGATPNFLTWRLEYLRTIWQAQDWPTVPVAGTQPLIDPDLIGPADLKNPVAGDPAFDLWQQRVTSLAAQSALIEAEPKTLAGFDSILTQTLGAPVADFLSLAAERAKGNAISKSLDQLKLSLDEFIYLLRIRDLASLGRPILDAEWESVYAILIQIFKRKNALDWRAKERAAGLVLSPDFFQIPPQPLPGVPSAKSAAIARWRAPRAARTAWQEQLQARMDQEQNVFQAVAEAISSTEASLLPSLRDALVLATDAAGADLQAKADWITGNLLIDARMDGCGITTRVAQAIETIQGLLTSLRTEQRRDVFLNFKLNADQFDEEWKWLGSYAPWRSAMFVFMYPENLSNPNLRRWQTPGFRELLRTTQAPRAVSPGAACRAARKYSDYFRDICSLRVEASCTSRTRLFHDKDNCKPESGYRCLFYMFGRGISGTVYWSCYDLQDSSGHAQTFWEPVKSHVAGFDNIVEVIGAAPFAISANQRFIFLFARKQQDTLLNIVSAKYDLENQRWIEDVTPFEVPIKVPMAEGSFSVVMKQQDSETEPPQLAVASLIRKLRFDGSGWEDPPFESLVGFIHGMLGAANDAYFVIRTRGDEGRPDDVMVIELITERPAGRFSFKTANRLHIISTHIFGPNLRYLGAFTWPDRDYVYVVTAPARPVNRIVGGINLGFLRRARVWRVRDIGGRNLEVKEVDSPFGFSEPRIVPTAGVVEDATSKSKRFLYQSDGDTAYFDRFLNLSDTGDLTPKEPFAAMPSVSGPFEISGQLGTNDLQLRKGLVQKAFSANRTGPASNLTYLEEAYYFVAIQLALGLQRGGEYIAALDWLRTAYDYTAPVSKRKIYDGLVREESLGDVYKRAPDWLLDPLNPHSIAATRRNTYTRYTLQAIVRCLLDFADAEFTRDTAESNPVARRLYLLALELLETEELKQHLGGCDEIVALLDNVVLGAEWSLNVLSLKSELKAIPDPVTLNNVTEEARLALAAEGAPEERFAKARQIVNEAVAEISVPTLKTLLARNTQVNDASRQTILKDVTIERAVHSVGKAAAHDFRRGMSMVTGFSEANLVSGRKELPWLRETALAGINGSPVSAMTRLDAARLDILAPAHVSDLAEIAATQPMMALDISGAAPPGFFPGAVSAFCVPPNPILKALRLRAELNLFKLRTCRNIAGIKRELDPYAAPTDTTTGLPTIGPAGQLNLPGASVIRPSLYTERVLRERAKELVGIAAQIEGEMLAALEKGAMERYAILKARHDLGLMQAGVRLQSLRITRANHGVKLAELQQERAEIQVRAYEEWIAQGLNEYEQQMVQAYKDIAEYQVDLAEIDANVKLGMALTTAATATFGAAAAAAAAAGVALAARSAIGTTGKLARSQRDAHIASINASFERRQDEWKLQAAVGQQDIEIGEQSVLLANDDVAISLQENTIAELGVTQARDVIEFLNNKFTNVELYESMSSTLEEVYREFLRQATAVARVYENQVAFLRQEAPPGFIKSDYWATPNDGGGVGPGNTVDRKGITGSARLLQDLYQLEQYAFDTRKRKLSLSKTISLASLAPAEFQVFRETGVMVFTTPTEIFDRDFPGHYLRMISKVRTSVIALVPPIQGIHATLSTSGLSRVVIGPDVFQTVPIRRDPELIALSTPINATGVLEMELLQSDMLYPFEGCGADATWELRMPKAANQIDYRTIADVLVTIEYTALNSFDYRDQVIQSLKPTLSGDLALSFRHHLPDQWYDLHNPDQTSTPMTVQFSIDRSDFPPNLEALKIQQVLIYFSRADGKSFEVVVNQLEFTPRVGGGPAGGGATSIEGVISTRRGNGAAWSAAFLTKEPFGDWKLVLPDTEEMRNRFRDDDIEDMLFVITYSGRTPEWPS